MCCRQEQDGFGRLPAPEPPFFAGPRRRRSGGEQRSWPEGRRAEPVPDLIRECPESSKVAQRNGLVQSADLTSRLCRGIWNHSRLRDTRCGHTAAYLGTEGLTLVIPAQAGPAQSVQNARRAAPKGRAQRVIQCLGSVPVLWPWPLLLRAGSALLYRGPYGAAGGWRKVRRMARRDASQFFAGTRRCRRKTP